MSNKGNKKRQITFPEDHWSVQSGLLESFRTKLPYAICILHVPKPAIVGAHRRNDDEAVLVPVGVSLNPTDSTNYRLLFRILVEHKEDLRLNEFPVSAIDNAVVGTGVAVLGQVLAEQTGLYLQSMQLGNNSQSWQHEDNGGGGCLILGNDSEPHFLHHHGFLRGNPHHCYWGSDLPPLGGPPVGTAIPVQSGPKRPWESAAQLRLAVARMQAALSAAAETASATTQLCRFEILSLT